MNFKALFKFTVFIALSMITSFVTGKVAGSLFPQHILEFAVIFSFVFVFLKIGNYLYPNVDYWAGKVFFVIPLLPLAASYTEALPQKNFYSKSALLLGLALPFLIFSLSFFKSALKESQKSDK